VFGPALVILLAQALLFRQSPLAAPGLYFYGAVLGLLSALVALGMALIYRANRILNFAQSELGLAPTVFALCLMAYAGLPYLVALGIGLVGALVVGNLVQVAVIERFSRAPRLILTVATIGLAQLLTVASLAIPGLWGKTPLSQDAITPFAFSFELAPITFGSGHIMAIVVAPLVLGAVAAFLRFTNAGIAIRAAAERSERAALLGVPVQQLNGVVWSVAALLSFTGVFLRAGVVGLPFSSSDGFGSTSFGALLAALTALSLGRFTNLPAVAVSAVALGIAEQQLIYAYGRNPALVYPMYGLIILVALGVRRVSRSRVDTDSVASWQAADDIRPIPVELRRNPEVLVVKWGGLGLLAYVAWRVPTLPFMEPSRLLLASAVVVFAIVGISIILLTGWAGQVSLGQMGFVGVGAAVGPVVTREWHLDLSIALVAAGAAGAVVALVVGLPALRLRGLFLAVTTLAFATTAAYFLLNPTYFGWIPTGRIERPPLFAFIDLESPATMYEVCLASLVLVILAVTGLRRSRTGRALVALREHERGAQAFGINTTRAKLTGFALSGFCAAFAGCLFVHLTRSFAVGSFTAAESFGVFTATVVGGLGGQTGAILGAVFSRGGTWFLQGSWQLLPSALGVLLVLLILPGGFSGLLFQLRDLWLRSVARRFGIVVPSLLADVAVDERTVVTHAEEQVEVHDAVGDRPVSADATTGDPDVSGDAAVGDPYVSAQDVGLTLPPVRPEVAPPDRRPATGGRGWTRSTPQPDPDPAEPGSTNGTDEAAAGPPRPPLSSSPSPSSPPDGGRSTAATGRDQ
jgi:branched-chain amino acid transport system permease protein